MTWDEWMSRHPMPSRLDDATRPADATESLAVVNGQWSIPGVVTPPPSAALAQKSATLQVLPVGSESVPGKPGVWRYFVEADGETPPF